MATDPSKTEKVTTWPTPTSVRETQQFLGFAGYYRRFVKDFAQVARPLHRLTEGPTNFVWITECQDAFDELRRRLTSTPILSYPDFSRQFVLDTDASDTGIGAVLSQIDGEGQERVVAYGSRLLTKLERRYCVTRRELLAVVTFSKQYRSYLTGQRFLLCILIMGPSPGCATSKNLRVSSHGGWRGSRSWTSTLCTGGVRNIQMRMPTADSVAGTPTMHLSLRVLLPQRYSLHRTMRTRHFVRLSWSTAYWDPFCGAKRLGESPASTSWEV